MSRRLLGAVALRRSPNPSMRGGGKLVKFVEHQSYSRDTGEAIRPEGGEGSKPALYQIRRELLGCLVHGTLAFPPGKGCSI